MASNEKEKGKAIARQDETQPIFPQTTTIPNTTSPPTTTTTITSSSSSLLRAYGQACAACSYQRRKCESGCPLAPYFSRQREWEFLNVHKLYGVGKLINILKILNSPDQRKNAMNSIIYECNVRAVDPVAGCYRIICHLYSQLLNAQMELVLVRQQLANLRAQTTATTSSSHQHVVHDHHLNNDRNISFHQFLHPQESQELQAAPKYVELHGDVVQDSVIMDVRPAIGVLDGGQHRLHHVEPPHQGLVFSSHALCFLCME